MGNKFLPFVCLLLGLVLGAGLMWLLQRPEEVLVSVGSSDDRALRDREVEWSRSGSSPSSSPPGAPGSFARRSSGNSSAELSDEPGEVRPLPVGGRHVAWFEVSVLDADGKPVEAEVYALGAGTRGGGGYELPQADHDPPSPCLLGVPAAGAWDVGVKTRSWSYIEKDLIAVSGSVTRVEVRVPPCKPVTVVVEGLWPKVEEFLEDEYPNHLRILPQDRDTEWFPGRDQAPSVQADLDDLSSGGPWTTAPLQTGIPLRARFATTKMLWDRRRSIDPPLLRIVVEPEELMAGDTIRLRLAPAAYLRVVLRKEKSRAWIEGPRPLLLHFEQDGRTQSRSFRMGGPYAFPKPDKPAAWYIGAPGPVTLRWEGEGWLSGRREGIPIEQGRQADVEVLLRLDPNALPNQEELKVLPSGLPRGGVGERTLDLYGLFVSEGRTSNLESWIDLGEPEALSPDWRRASWILARSGSYVSRPIEAPASGPLKADMHLAGKLVVVPEFPVDPDGADLMLRRADGLPFFVMPEPGMWRVDTEFVAGTGTVLGPLSPGACTFEVRLGGVRLPDATATVVAGKAGVLKITRE